jgi:hypothetical protein
MLANSIGGRRNGGNGEVEYVVPMAVSGGSELLIFARRTAHIPDLWLSGSRQRIFDRHNPQ